MANTIHADRVIPSFRLYDTCDIEVSNLIHDLNPKKSNRTVDTPTNLIKCANYVIAPILSNIFTYCMSQGGYPDQLKSHMLFLFIKRRARKMIALPTDQSVFWETLIEFLKKLSIKDCTTFLINSMFSISISMGFEKNILLPWPFMIFWNQSSLITTRIKFRVLCISIYPKHSIL